MSANIIDQRTANLGMPLPNVNNMQDQDCGRIAESLRMLDAAHGKVRTDIAKALEAAQNAKGAALYANVPIDQVPADVLAGMAVGQFITVPEADGAGGVDMSAYVTKAEVAARWAFVAELHVGGGNASDVWDEGRGLSARADASKKSLILGEWMKLTQ